MTMRYCSYRPTWLYSVTVHVSLKCWYGQWPHTVLASWNKVRIWSAQIPQSNILVCGKHGGLLLLIAYLIKEVLIMRPPWPTWPCKMASTLGMLWDWGEKQVSTSIHSCRMTVNMCPAFSRGVIYLFTWQRSVFRYGSFVSANYYKYAGLKSGDARKHRHGLCWVTVYDLFQKDYPDTRLDKLSGLQVSLEG